MIAFHITVNGQRFCESEDVTVFTMVTEEVRRSDGYRVSLHAQAGESPVQWLAANLKAGDGVVLRVVDVTEIDDAKRLECSFCGRDVHDVHALVQGPTAAICDGCMGAFSEAIAHGTRLPVGAAMRDEPEWICQWCANQTGSNRGVIVRNGAAICAACLRACLELGANPDR